MEKETWRPVKGYEGLYEVSDLGRVRSLDRRVSGKTVHKDGQFKSGKILKPYVNSLGYSRITLSKEGSTERFQLHRLVAEAFIPNREGLPCVSHEDDDPSNNRASNLRWCTYSYNNNRERHRRLLSEATSRNAPNRRRVAKYTLDGELVAVYRSIIEAAEANGVLFTGVQTCCAGGQKDSRKKGGFRKVNSYKGFVWKYIST